MAAAALAGAALDWAASALPLPWPGTVPGAALRTLPALLFWAAAPPALTAMAFPDRRGQSRGIFVTSALGLACAALGLTLGPRLALGPAAAADLAAVAGATACWPWARSRQAIASLRLWPGYTIGVFQGEIHGHDLGVSLRLSKTALPAACLGAAAAAMAVSQPWASAALTGLFGQAPPGPASLAQGAATDPGPTGPAAWLALAALGALVLGPILAGLSSPVTSLALAMAVTAAGALRLALAPEGHELDRLAWERLAWDAPAWEALARSGPRALIGRLLDGLPLIGLGALWPLSARIQLAKSPVIPRTVGRLHFLLLASLLAGAGAGLAAASASSLGLPDGPLRLCPALAAWTGATLALGPSLGWPSAAVLWGLASGLACWRWW